MANNNLYVKTSNTPARARNLDFQKANLTNATSSISSGGGGVNAFNQLTDVSINDLVTGQFTYYNGSDWVNTGLIKVDSNQITITDLNSTNIGTTNLTVTKGNINTLISTSIDAGTVAASTINTTNLTATSEVTANNINSTTGTITTLESDTLNTLTLNCTDINISNNLNIQGQINNLNGVVTNVTDAWIQLNTGNNLVNAGIQVQTSTDGTVSKLYRNVNGLWYVDDKQILTGTDVLNTKLTGFLPDNTPIVATHNILQGFNATQGQINNRPQYNVNESILNRWTFKSGLDSSTNAKIATKLTAGYIGINNVDMSSGRGISLWNDYQTSGNSGCPDYGLFVGGTYDYKKHGRITGYLATYFTMNSEGYPMRDEEYNMGWIYRNTFDDTNIASIDINGNGSFNGDLGTGANLSCGVNLRKEGGIEIYHNSTPYIDFHYGNSSNDYTSRIIENQAGYLNFSNTSTSFDGIIGGSQTFTSGFAGQGWRLQNNSLELDNLTVRGSMKVYELVVNQVKATNGNLYVSDSYRAKYNWLGGNYDMVGDDDNGKLRMPFQNGDIVTSQTFDGKNVVKIVGIVRIFSEYSSNMFGLQIPLIEGQMVLGQTYDWVRTGNVSNTDRQGAIYLTSSDSNSPYIDVVDGSNGLSTNTPRRIRYIRDWMNGSNFNLGNHWVEIKAHGTTGVNIAYGKPVYSNFAINNSQAVTNNATTSNDYTDIDSSGARCYLMVDLQAVYDINEVVIWHYFVDSRTYNETKTEVSTDGITWYSLFDSALQGTYQETAEGRTYKLGATKTKARLGRLDGIIDNDYGLLSGYGLYAENVFLKGGIIAKYGKIGAFQLDSEWIKYGNAAFMAGQAGNNANGLMFGKGLDGDYPGMYVQWSGNNDNVYGNISIGKILKHGWEWTPKLGINFYHNGNTIFEMSRNTNNGDINCEIAGWQFNTKGIYKNDENYLVSLGNSTSGDIYNEGKRGLTIRYIKTGITDGYCELMALGQIPLRQWSLKEDGISSYDGLTEYDTGTYGLLVRANNNEVIRLDGTSNSHLNGIQVPRGGGLHDNGVLFGGYGIGVSTSNDSYSGDWYRFKVFNSENYETRSGYNTGGIAALNTNIRNYLFNGQDVDGMIMMSKHHLRNNQVWQQQSPIVTAKHYTGEQYVFLGGAVTCAGRRTPIGGSSSISAKEVELFDCFKVNSNLTLPPETEMRPYLVFEGKQITLVNTTANNINISGIRNSITTTTGVKTIPPFKTAIFTFVNNSWYSEQ